MTGGAERSSNQLATDRTDLALMLQSLSSDTLSVSSLTTQAMEAPGVRQDRVEALRQQVQNGDYKLEADKTARAILQQNKRAE